MRYLLDGPARAIFARKLGDLPEGGPSPEGRDLVLCGSSLSSPLERRAVRAARAAGVRSAVWLDHWTNYPTRFVLDGATALPDELWVADEHAARIARATLPGPPVIVQGNPYLDEIVGEIRALETAARRRARALRDRADFGRRRG